MTTSTTRYAEPIHVPRLKQKLGILYLQRRGPEGDAELGRLFGSDDDPEGVTGKAVRNWIYGEGNRSEDHVPANRFPRLVEIFRSRMAGSRSTAEVTAMLLAATELDVVLAFHTGAPRVEWIERVLGAAPSAARIILPGPAGLLNVTSRRRAIEQIDGRVMVPVGKAFRFELDDAQGWLAVVQWGRSGWFAVEIDGGVVLSGIGPGVVRLPSVPPYLDEDEPGARRYLFLTLRQPFPADIEAVLTTSSRSPATLDSSVLVRLAHLLDTDGAEISALDVTFVSPGTA